MMWKNFCTIKFNFVLDRKKKRVYSVKALQREK